ncbi:MAG: hypothetical protein COT32_02190, partial [Candidatus Nealsonbacteria bacterium CG08_land_8_20_14_0_20_36_22]
ISGILLEILILFYLFNLVLFLILIISAPIISSLLVLFFQIPTVILVKKTLKKAKEKKEQFKNLIVIGITGSYGKSSTKEFLATILSEKFKVLKTPKNINAEIGIAKTILNELKPEHQVFIAEIGAYERGKIKEVCRMLGPKIGILTGINEQHLSTFGSLENIKKAKYELIESLPRTIIVRGLPEDGIAIIRDKLDLRADDIRVEKEYIFFKVSGVNFKVNLLGIHNIDNILLSASCAQKLGMSLEEISRACLKIKPEQGGMKFLRKDAPVVIDSSYSANPDGVIADLDYLKTLRQAQGKLIIVMPCLIELGRVSKEVHKRIGRKIGEVCDLAIITTRDYFKEIKKTAEIGSLQIFLIENPKEIIAKIKEFCKNDDVVLLEGRVPKEIKSVKFF